MRSSMRHARRAVSPLFRRRAAAAATRRIGCMAAFRRARDVGLYVASDGEIDPAALSGLAWRRGKRVWVPVAGPAGNMEFALLRRQPAMKKNRFGIPEPPSFRRQRRRGRQLDFVVVPLVAFDRTGRRLGMGGGYYDRAFSGARRPVLAGLAYSLQETPGLPDRPWDVPLDVIVTEQEAIRPRAQHTGDRSK
ncbi:MAG: 5-formyltetrahydrofolate cyclo-ligase [Gammaproteobacteria bacterium]